MPPLFLPAVPDRSVTSTVTGALIAGVAAIAGTSSIWWLT